MTKEQLYSSYIEFKEGEDVVGMGNECTTGVEVVGNTLVIERLYSHGKGKVIYNLDTIKYCSVIPLSPEANEAQLKTFKGEA